jgi:hypothetical protein
MGVSAHRLTHSLVGGGTDEGKPVRVLSRQMFELLSRPENVREVRAREKQRAGTEYPLAAFEPERRPPPPSTATTRRSPSFGLDTTGLLRRLSGSASVSASPSPSPSPPLPAPPSRAELFGTGLGGEKRVVGAAYAIDTTQVPKGIGRDTVDCYR